MSTVQHGKTRWQQQVGHISFCVSVSAPCLGIGFPFSQILQSFDIYVNILFRRMCRPRAATVEARIRGPIIQKGI